MSTLKTLERGLTALKIVSRRADGITIAELAEALDVHRAIAYRIVATLEEHGLIHRRPGGTIGLGAGILELEARFLPQLRSLAQPVLIRLSERTRATAFVSLAQGEEAAAIAVAEPEDVLIRVGYRVGSRHGLNKGAAGIAILAGRPEQAGEDPTITQARADGYSLTKGQLQPGAIGVAAPVSGLQACVGVVAMEDLSVETSVTEVKAAAERLAELCAQ